MDAVSIAGLCKQYERFSLKDVSFCVAEGSITGFIGRNGAGKTTTLKSILHFVHPNAGEVCFFGRPFAENELACKKMIGYVPGAFEFYPQKKLRVITSVTRRFYPAWDEGVYRRCCGLFALDEEKRPKELSTGMKVKYALALALSHGAKLLILDEPTSGLDPVSRAELLDIFLQLVKDGKHSILFSTHITSDLQKCADHIVYIRDGAIAADTSTGELLARYELVQLTAAQRAAAPEGLLIGCREDRTGYTALVPAGSAPEGTLVRRADLDSIMVHLEHREGVDLFA